MSRGKEYTTTEIAEIKGYLDSGCTYAEIAELMGRTKKSIEILSYRQGWTKERRLRMEAEKASAMPKTLIEDHEPVMEKTLKDFKARDMIKYLYDLGYRIEDNKLVCYVKQAVNVKDIIHG